VDLTPGVVTPRRRRSPMVSVVLVVVLVALGVVVYKGLSSASLYFYNADEAVAHKQDLGAKTFRLQGTVLGSTVEESDDGVDFAVAYNGVRVEAHHHGDPPELFKPGIPVVLEGHWAGSGKYFDSDRILVKHSATYTAQHKDRLDEATTTTTAAP
jgi:cytochrome c-type biogenesis protein CcmE